MKTQEAKRDLIVYAALALASVVFYVWVIPVQIYLNASAKAEAFSPDTFPRFVTIVFFLAAAGGLVNSARLYRKALAEEGRPAKGERRALTGREILAGGMPYVIFLLVVLYGVLFAVLGFVWATVLTPPVILFVIGCRKWQYYIILYAFVGTLYALFRFVLLVPIH